MGCCSSSPSEQPQLPLSPSQKAEDSKYAPDARRAAVGSHVRPVSKSSGIDEAKAASILATGAEVMMLPRGKGKPRPQFLYLDRFTSAGPTLRWNAGPGTKPDKDCVLLADVTDMFDGQRTAAFKEHAKRFSNRGPLSFSLACGDGTTLDVIVGSEVKKRLWMTCLRTLLEREAPTFFPSTIVNFVVPDSSSRSLPTHGAQAPLGTDTDTKGADDGPTALVRVRDAGGAQDAAAAQEASAMELERQREAATRAEEQKVAAEAAAAAEAQRREDAARAAAQKQDAIQDAELLVRGVVEEVRAQLGDSGAYTGEEVMSVVRAVASKRSAAVR